MHSIARLERPTQVGDDSGAAATSAADNITAANDGSGGDAASAVGAIEPADLDSLADVRQHVDLLFAAMEGEQRIALFGELGRFFDRKGKDAAFEQKRLDMLEFSQARVCIGALCTLVVLAT